MSKDLPSYEDFSGDESLPSVEDYITEENAEELPSVEDFIEEEVISEETVTIEDADGNAFAEVKDIIPPFPELIRLINDVRKDIPDIPEVKYYDRELEDLAEQISQLPEVKYYDKEVEAICSQIDLVREQIKDLPEVKYYDEQVNSIEDRIDSLQTDVVNLPEVKYYDAEIEAICGAIDEVKASIPKFPKWVNEINEVPDFSWIGKTFSVIDEDFVKVNDAIDTLEESVSIELKKVSEENEVKHFENRVQFGTEVKDLDNKLEEEKGKIWKELRSSSMKIWEYHKTFKDDDRKLKKQILGEYNNLKDNLDKRLKEVNESSVKTDELLLNYFTDLKEQITGIPEVKYYDEDIDYVKSDIKGLRKIIEDIKSTQNQLQEEQKLLAETNVPLGEDPPDTKNSDPLTPLDQNFVTLDQLQQHYKRFVERVQYQLGSIGGGGAGFIKDLDDVDISGLEDGYVLKWNSASNKWKPEEAGGVGAGGTWASNTIGISTTKNVGIGTTTAKSGVALFVAGDIEATNVNVAGTITYEDVKNVDSLGLSTFRSGIEVNAGTATTALLVRGDARITGILTVGTASVTIDGDNNTVSVGIVTITNSEVILGDNVTLNAAATGINSAPNVLYVAKDGIDTNNGTSIDNAKLTIKSAVSIAQSGTVIKVLSGNYVEANPITLPAFTAVVGDDLRTVKVLPSTPTSDIFHVNKACKLANMTFSGHVAPAAAVAFPTGIATNVGGGKWKGPYIQNCTSDTTTGTGIFIDGNKAEKTKSMNVDAFTQYNQGGVGVAVTNEGYAQLVSVFTICCDKAITVHKGGQADLANSNCSFGTQGLVADGVSPQQFTGIVTSSATAGQDNVTINVGSSTTRPYDGQVVYFDQLFKSIESITVGSGGTGYTQAPTVTIDAPTGPSGETASAFATIENGAVTEISIISSGSQYTSTPSITISGPQSGISTATATANMADIYYTINSATPIVSGITTLTLAENLINTVGVGSTSYFFQQSKIVASSHTFEYIGSGNTITLATPKRGGVTIQANEVVSQNGGRVIYTSTDQAGNFRIGDDLQINQATGTISGRAFSKSLFSEITPFILALS
jgi:prefoldin subunit 5